MMKSYGMVRAIRGITLKINRGEIFGVVGPRGSGKSTLLELLIGIREADGGQLNMLGMDADKHANELKEHIGFQLQHTSLHERIKVKEVLKLFRSYYKKKRDLNDIISMLALKPYLNHYVMDLTENWKKRIAFALALVNDPEIIFLDEPSAGLEPQAQTELWEILGRMREEGKTIIVSTPHIEEAQQHCDRVALIVGGEVSLCSTPQEIKRKLLFGTNSFDQRNLQLTALRWRGETA
ncbi:ABC transporter ATP-binding protein [Paenibacillus sp. MMS18-CY102]|uniref:ABC transporter ATP-binding protein n=1 Tax=Paenibacillus sp. MMS18-CY102 TaxID=2682849 RepID=UPI001365B948|nr:ABC transporter ATP-binding protein [Paenibacillus sp. MMS18-CY102]MWC30000.1 ATP-binding cassette domain-containing protein [Paenibacillus sp. MMS18-CY102]